MKSGFIPIIALLASSVVFGTPCAFSQGKSMSNLDVMNTELSKQSNSELADGYARQGFQPDQSMGPLCGRYSLGGLGGSGGGGQASSSNLALKTKKGQDETFELTDQRKIAAQNITGQSNTKTDGETDPEGHPQFLYDAQQQTAQLKDPDPMTSALADPLTGNQRGGGGGGAFLESNSPLAMLTNITGGGGC